MKKFFGLIFPLLIVYSAAAQDVDNGMHVVSVNTTYQYLTPLDLHVSSFNLTQLRESFAKNEDLAEVLTSIQTTLKDEKATIAAAQKTLKAERSLYDAQMELYKARKALSAELNKQMESNIKKLNDLLRQMDKQNQILSTLDNSSEAVAAHRALLEQIKQEFLDAISKHQQIKIQAASISSESLNQEFDRINNFLIELTDKETRPNSLMSQNKANTEIINSTLKSTEAAIKAAAKGK